jgi:serine/threonine-protein kinase
MLAGVAPFLGETPLAIAVKHLHDPPPPLRKHNPGLPPAVEGIVLKCLQKDPAARYPNAAALLADLQAVRDGLQLGKPLNWMPAGMRSAPAPAAAGSVALPPPPRPVVVKQVVVESDEPSARILLLGLLGMVLAVVAAFFGLSWFIFRTTPEVALPDVRSKTRLAAIDILRRAGLKVEVKEHFNDRFPRDVVYMEDPVPPRAVKQESVVELHVSKGPAPAVVPDVVGRPVGQAQEAVREAGLSTAPLREEFSDTARKGEVIAQEPAPAAELSRGGTVVLTVSRGPEPIPMSPPVVVAPVTKSDADLPDGETSEERRWEVTVRVPDTPDHEQNVRIEVQDEDGTVHDEYSADHQPGEEVRQSVSGFGGKGKVHIRIYLDGRKIRDLAF